MNDQLVLGLQLRDSARFSNFVAGPNEELLDQLQRLATVTGSSQFFVGGRQVPEKPTCCRPVATRQPTQLHSGLSFAG